MKDLCSGSLAAIFLKSKEPIQGTGFFIAQQLVVTCSHIIVSEEEQKRGTCYPETVYIRPFGSNDKIGAKILDGSWSNCQEDDLAVLKLIGPITKTTITPLSIGFSINSQKPKKSPIATKSRKATFQSFGYTKIGDEYDGLWDKSIKIDGIVKNRADHQRLQLNSNRIARGFSGAPLYDPDSEKVVGIIAEVFTGTKPNDLAYAIPIEALWHIASPSLVEFLKSEQIIPNMPDQLSAIHNQNQMLNEWKDQHSRLDKLGISLEIFYQRIAALQNQRVLIDDTLHNNWEPFEQGLFDLVKKMQSLEYIQLQPPNQPTIEWVKEILTVSNDIHFLITQKNMQNMNTLFKFTSNLHNLIQNRLTLVDDYLQQTAKGLEQLIAFMLSEAK